MSTPPQALAGGANGRRVKQPVLLGRLEGPLQVRAQSCHTASGAARAETQLSADGGAPRALNRIVCGLPRGLKLVARVRCQVAGLCERLALNRIAQHTEEVDDVTVQIVVDLAVGARLLQQHAGRATEGLGVDLMWRKEFQDPRRQTELAAVVPERGTGDGGQAAVLRGRIQYFHNPRAQPQP